MNYLITGGAGFIGSHLSQELVKQGNNIIIIDNYNDYYNPNIKEMNTQLIKETARQYSKGCKIYKGDIREKGLIDKIFFENNIDIVIALAANAGVRPSIEKPLYYVDVNLVGLTNILETMREYGCKSLVFASSSSVYGNNKKVPFSEDDFVDNPISPYAATKKSGELLCYTYHALFGMSIACLRYFTVYGPRQRPDLAINKFTRLMLQGEEIPMYGDGTTARDYTFVSDIVNGTMRAADYITKNTSNSVYDVFNLGGSNPISLSKLIEIIGETLEVTPTIKQLPMQPGDVDVTYSDYSKAKTKLGYEPSVNIEEGIKHFIDWYIENKEVYNED